MLKLQSIQPEISNAIDQCFPNCVRRKIFRCATGIFKILDIYHLFFKYFNSFQPKLSNCCNEIMDDNVGDRVMLAKKRIIAFLAVTCNATRHQYGLIHVAVVPRNMLSFFTAMTTDKKV